MVQRIGAAGLEIDGLEEKLGGLLANGQDHGVLTFDVPVGTQEQRLNVELDIYQEDGKYLLWHHYYLRSPREAGGFEHFVNNNIDSAELEQRFAKLDWSGGMEEKHWSAIAGIDAFGAGYAGRNEEYQRMILAVAEGLLCRYLGGRPAEAVVLSATPAYRDLLYQPHFYWSEVPLEYAIRKIYEPKLGEWPVSKISNMNINKMNLENLQAEMRALKVDEQLITAMEKEMGRGRPLFELRAAVLIDRGQMDLTLHFKQSGSSEFYYMNRYEISMTSAKPLEAGRQYFAISNEKNEKGEQVYKSFVNAAEAMEYFKATPGVKELAVGKTPGDKFTLATRDAVKVDYVDKDFKLAYYGTIRTNTFYVDRGKGINVQQGINLMQGRAIYRDDLVNRGTNEVYKAWNTFEFNEAKDKYGNFKIKQYGENYGVDVIKELGSYNIKELADPKKEAEIIAQLKDGHRPLVTVKDAEGTEQQLRIEAMPRYGNFNFYRADGKMEKREQFQKQPILATGKGKSQGQEKKAGKGQSQGMSV
ncbi:hypothetical protein [Pedobacter sp.]